MFQKSLLAGLLACVAASLVLAGPPLICHPHDIGSAKSLPWISDGTAKWDNPDPGYSVRRLSADTLNLLQPEMPVTVRLETLRRAAVYGLQDHAAALELLSALRVRSERRRDVLAYFDYGCFASALQEMKWWYKEDLSQGVQGAELVNTAAKLKHDPDMFSVLSTIESYR
jgi:hypothetical protein